MARTFRLGADNNIYVDDGTGGEPERRLSVGTATAVLSADELAEFQAGATAVAQAAIRDVFTIYAVGARRYMSDGYAIKEIDGGAGAAALSTTASVRMVQPGTRVMASPPAVTLVRAAGIAAEFPSRVDIGPLDTRLLSTANMGILNAGWVADGAIPKSVVGDATNTDANRQPGGTQMHTIFTDADKIAVKVFGYQGAPKMQFKINGDTVSLTPVTVPADSEYSWYVFSLAGAREPRLITALIAGETMMFCGFSVPSNAAVFQCPRPRRDLLAGDSFVFSDGVTTPTDTLPVKFAERLGSLNVWASGVGGTGYLTTNGGLAQTLRQRIDSDIVPFVRSGDRVWVLMGTNDWGSGLPAASVATELGLTAEYMKTKLRGVELVFATPWRPRAAANGNNAYDNTILAAIQAAGVRAVDVRVVYTGTGKVGATTGDGNSDVAIQADGVHPTGVGHGIGAAYLIITIGVY